MKMKNLKKNYDVSWIIKALPKKYRSRAFSLLRYIAKNYDMKWDKNGVFIYKNKLIPQSNILHLVLHALLKKIKDKPPGMIQFYEGLQKINIPENLVKNIDGRRIIQGYVKDENWGSSN